MALLHNVRAFQPDNANPERAEWNHDEVIDAPGQIDPESMAKQIMESIPDDPDQFGVTGFDANPDHEPKSIWKFTKSNEEMKNLGDGDPDGSLSDRVRHRINQQVDEIRGRGNRVQSNSVKFVEHLFTASPHYFRPDGPANAAGVFDKERTKEWLKKTVDFAKEIFGDNLAGIHIHMDEATPHIHVETVPETEDGRLSVNDRYTPGMLHEMQNAYAESMPEEIQKPDGRQGEEKTPQEIYEKLGKDFEKYENFKENTLDDLKRLRDLLREWVDADTIAEIGNGPDPGDEDNPVDYVMDNEGINSIDATVHIAGLIAETAQDIGHTKTKVESLQIENERLKTQLEDVESTNNELVDEIRDLEKRIDELEPDSGPDMEMG